jgi:acyl-coenzyme A thioesterase PaaI-like protein
MDLTEVARRLLEPIPANQSIGLKVLRARDGEAAVGVDAPAHLANVIGSLHSSGLVALVDAAGLAALIASARSERQLEGIIPLGTAAQLEFHAPARGSLIARCKLGPADATTAEALFEGRSGKVSLTTTVDVVNQSGATVCTGSFLWNVRRAPANA